MKIKARTIMVTVIFVLICLAIGGVSGLLSSNAKEVYEGIILPPLSPPSFLFGVVWTILYTLMGISGAIIYEMPHKKRRTALTLFIAQLIINGLWTILYFTLGQRLLSFFWIILLDIVVAAMIFYFYKIKKIAGYLQIPYMIWISFASYLTFATWLINK